MTTQISFFKSALLLTAFLGVFASCKKEDIVKPVPVDNTPLITKAQFATETIELHEGFQSQYVEILLNPKPTRAGTVTVAIEDLEAAVYQSDYITIPGTEEGKIQLAVEPGSEKVSFRIMSADDELHNQARSIKLTLEQSASAHIKPEGKISSVVTLKDNENYSKIGFVENRSSVFENEQTGKEITLKIEPAAMGNGYIDIDVNMNGVSYGQHFTTLPAAINGKVRVMVTQGQQTASFKVIPVNDYFYSSTKILNFKIAGTTENLKPFGFIEQEFFIIEDGENNRLSIKSIQNNYTGRDMYYVFPVTISGRVVSKNDNVSPKKIFIQDETGGIAVELTGNNTIPMGENVTIHLEGGLLTEKNEILTIKNIPNQNIERNGFDLWVVPVMTLQELAQKPRQLEGTMVTLKQVSFGTSNLGNTLEGDVDIADGQYAAKMRTESFASFKDQPIPAGKRDVTGVLIWTSNGYIILPQRAADIR